MRTPVSVGVVGALASAGQLADAFQQLPQAELRWLCGEQRTARAAVPRRAGVRRTQRVGELFDDERLDAIVLAVPAAARYELAAGALESDKHVYVAGALAQQGEQADALLQQARLRGRCLVAGDIHLFDPAVDRLEALLRTGELGEVLYVRGERHIFGRGMDEDDLLWGPGADELSLALHIIGDEPVSVDARGEAYLDPAIPDVLDCWLSFATGITAHLHLSALDSRPMSRLAVVGSDATALLERSPASSRRLTLYAKGRTEQRGEGRAFTPGDVFCPQVPDDDPVRRSCEAFLASVRSTVEPASRGREAAMLVETLEGIHRSLGRGASVELRSGPQARDLRVVGLPTPAR